MSCSAEFSMKKFINSGPDCYLRVHILCLHEKNLEYSFFVCLIVPHVFLCRLLTCFLKLTVSKMI